MGRASRLVSLSRTHTSVLYHLGAEDKLVAVDSSSDPPPGCASIPRLDPDSASLVPDLKNLGADVVITSNSSLRERLKGSDVQVAVMPLERGTMQDVYRQIRAVAELAGAEEGGEELVHEIQGRLVGIKEAAAQAQVTGSTCVIEFGAHGIIAGTSASTLGRALSLVFGVENVADSVGDGETPTVVFSPESLLVAKPKYYIVAHSDTAFPELALESAQKIEADHRGRILRSRQHHKLMGWSMELVDILEDLLEQMQYVDRSAEQILPDPAPGTAWLPHQVHHPMGLTARQVARALHSRSASFGLDIVKPFSIGWYNHRLEQAVDAGTHGVMPLLPDYGRTSGNCLAFLVGHTESIWEPFLSWLAQDVERFDLERPGPLETYVEEMVRRSCAWLLRGVPHEIFWCHEKSPGRKVDVSWAAELSGLAYVDEEVKIKNEPLLLHPLAGPWFTIRAIVVCDLKAMGTCCPPPLPCPLSDNDRERAKVAMKEVSTDKLPVNVRDAVKVGSKYRFSDGHIKYVNTEDRKLLRELVIAHHAAHAGEQP